MIWVESSFLENPSIDFISGKGVVLEEKFIKQTHLKNKICFRSKAQGFNALERIFTLKCPYSPFLGHLV